MRARLLTAIAFVVCIAGRLEAAAPCDIGVPADLDQDGDVDAADFALFQRCQGGTLSADDPLCRQADLNRDGRTDESDFLLWQARFSGDAQCGPLLKEPRAAEHLPEPNLAYPRVSDDNGTFHVHGHSGEFVWELEDLRIRGRGIDLAWARTYRSRTGSTTAMGWGWDFSYNIWLEPAGADFRLHDGRGRSDLLLRQGNGTWTRPELFAVLSASGDVHTLEFADGVEWRFRAMSERVAPGRIHRIVDRNGNALGFLYDVLGRLVEVQDTLHSAANERALRIAYNDAGFIDSLTDFTGRRVKYAYYGSGDPAGGPGDLKNVTSPAVNMTPSGNDFPSGKTVTYTYSVGFSDERLNHNLLSATDARGQTWLVNTYGAAPDLPDALLFDRVVRQVYGGGGDQIDIVYEQEPAREGGAIRTRATVNDRAGNVRTCTYDSRNRLVAHRRYTGRADADLPTYLSTGINAPSAPLRQGDPAYYETRYEYNNDSLCTLIVHPDGRREEYLYPAIRENPRISGNLLRRTLFPGEGGADAGRLVEVFEYDAATNRLSRHIGADGAETRYYHDEAGNIARVQHAIPSIVEYYEYNAFGQVLAHVWPDGGSERRRRDEYAYYAGGPQMGYLQSETIDARGLALTTQYEYDALGRVVRKTDPRGNSASTTWNALDQMVLETSRELESEKIRYQRYYLYDANNNLSEVHAGVLDEQGRAVADTPLSVRYEYDVLNRLIARISPASPTQSVSEEYGYDANGNLSLVRQGEAVSGRQPANATTILYDERDLPFRVIRAAGDPLQASREYEYNAAGLPIRVQDGIESGAPRVSWLAYDGFGRLVRRTDPMGNIETLRLDAAGRTLSRRIDGELNDVPGSTGNVRLSEVLSGYDPMGRLARRVEKVFDAQTQAAVGDGEAVTRYEYTDTGLLRSETDDAGATTTRFYDGAGRLVRIRDARGNTREYQHDANGNRVGVVETELSDLGARETVHTRTFDYDGLDRLSRAVEPGGGTWRYGYDLQGNCVVAVDPRGVQTRYVYDDLGRLTATLIDMNNNGARATDAADIVTSQRWDASSRLIARTDANLNTTSYSYDALDRLTEIRYADGTNRTITHSADGTTHIVQPTGSVLRDTFDRLGRLTSRTIARGAGVSGTAAESYAYDGLSRLVAGSDDDSAITRQYNSLSCITRETQQVGPGGPVRTVDSTYDTLGRRLSLAYPGPGRRVVTASYDALGRPTALRDESPNPGGPIVTYSYAGPERVERTELGNGIRFEPAYDRDRRMTSFRYVSPGGDVKLEERTLGADEMGNRTEIQILAGTIPDTRSYFYDPAGRLVQSQRGAGPLAVSYTLDGVGNRLTVSGGTEAGSYLLNPGTPQPADFQMNQYTSIPGQPRTYDAIGGLLTAGSTRRYSYDYRGQLAELTDLGSRLTVIYKYDVLGRRIEKNTDGAITRHYYLGDDEIEEQNPSNITLTTYVQPSLFGAVAGPDQAPLQIAREAGRFYLLADDVGSALALSGATGAIVERYDYTDFGRPAFTDASGAVLSSSPASNPFLFRGRRYDAESGFYMVGMTDTSDGRACRLLDPAAGRLIHRLNPDIWTAANFGNSYAWSNHNPLSAFKSSIIPAAGTSTGFDFPTASLMRNTQPLLPPIP